MEQQAKEIKSLKHFIWKKTVISAIETWKLRDYILADGLRTSKILESPL